MRSVLVASLSLVVLACGPTGVSDGSGESSSGSSTDAQTGSSTDADTGTTDAGSESETGEVVDPCGCAESELCVGTCTYGAPGIPAPEPDLEDLRCVDAGACVPGAFDNPECSKVACGSYFHPLDGGCGPEALGVDVICSELEPLACTVEAQDCPEGDKCVFLPPELDDVTALCLEVVGAGAPGDACTGEGAFGFTDSCGANSMCWSGASTTEPFEGTCLRFCLGLGVECPMGSSCTQVAEGIELCVPDMP